MSKILSDDIIDRFCRTLPAKTASTYKTALGQWAIWMSSNGKRVANRSSAQEWIDYLVTSGTVKPNTIRTYAGGIQSFVKWRDGRAMSLTYPSLVIGEVKSHPVEQVMRMVAEGNPLERAIAGLLFDTGCRLSEVLKLETKDVDWERGLITVTRKGGRTEQVAVSEQGMELLKDWFKQRQGNPEGVFLPYVPGKNYATKSQMVRAWLETLAHRVGIEDFTPHHLRHSRARHLLDNEVPLNDVSEILGHTNPVITATIYGRSKAERRKRLLTPWAKGDDDAEARDDS